MTDPFVHLRIPAEYNQDRIVLWPRSLKGPYIHHLIALTGSKLMFDGYFRIENEMLPVDRILYLIGRKREWHIRITGCKRGEGTSTPWYDEEVGEHICLTPSEIIELTFDVVATALPGEAWKALEEAITAREKSEEFVTQNTLLYNARNYDF